MIDAEHATVVQYAIPVGKSCNRLISMVRFSRQLELKPHDLANVAYTINLANINLLNQLLSGESQ